MNNKLIAQVFEKIEYGQKQSQCTEEYKKWIKSIKDHGDSEFHDTIGHIDIKKIYKTHLHLKRLSELVKQNKMFIADVYMENNSLYSRASIMKLIEELIQHIDYFASHVMLLLKDGQIHSGTPNLDCYQSLPLRCIASFIIPLLTVGYEGSIVTNENTFHPILLFSQLCTEAGFGSYINVVKREAQDLFSENILDLYPRVEVKMIIFEETDLHSVVDCIVDAVWNMGEKQPNWLVNVLVQESVYADFKNMLKQRMQQCADQQVKTVIPEGCSYYDDALNEYRSTLEIGSTRAFEVFQVSKSAVMTATVLFNNQFRTSLRYPIPVIGVDTFRTEAEALTMCNNNEVGRAASVWTESVTAAARVANTLEVDTVWINGFDLVHPISSQITLPQDSVYRCTDIKGKSKPDSKVQQPPATPSQLSFGQDVVKCWEKAEASVLGWMKCKNRLDVFDNVSKNLVASGNDKFKDLGEIIALWSAVPVLSGKYVSNGNFRIETVAQPIGIVCIELTKNSPLSDSVYTIIAAVAFGNCVLVSACADLYQDLIEWSQCCKFPAGVVNIFQQRSSECITPIQRTLIPLTSVKFAFWCFGEGRSAERKFTELEFVKLFSELCVFRSEFDCIYIDNVKNISVAQFERISTKPKFIWFPSQ